MKRTDAWASLILGRSLLDSALASALAMTRALIGGLSAGFPDDGRSRTADGGGVMRGGNRDADSEVY